MRYIIGALSILLVIIGATVTNSCYMSSITDEAVSYVEEALSDWDTDDMDSVIHTAHVLDRFWDTKRSYLESVLMHSELDDITVTISDFVSAAGSGDEDSFRSNGRLLCVQLRHLAELEKFRIGNIL